MIKKLILIVAVFAGLPIATVMANSDIAGIEIAGIEIDGIETASVITHGGHPMDCLSPIAVTKIDGEQKIVPARGFNIEAGVHTLNGRAILDTTFCTVSQGGNRGGYAPDLEVNFEVGKTYHIGYDHRSENRDDWKLVVWKVE